METTPAIKGIVETALYVDDLARARTFYEHTLGLKILAADHRFCAFAAGGQSVLLLFLRGAALELTALEHGIIPPHDGSGPLHAAFAIARDELGDWEAKLEAAGVAIIGKAEWQRGGRSLYFRDPDGHLLELATPGLWPVY